jgi:predicted site-specific integrase-resolvase
MTIHPESKLLNAADLAARLGLHYATICRWRRRGIISGRRVPAMQGWWFDVDEVRLALRQHGLHVGVR